MFSAIKKLASKSDATTQGNGSATAVPMSGSLQKKFSRGVQYNMKIIIKGDRNVGKSCLLERLQGRSFLEAYTPTEQIQAASIQWSFKATEDVVKVEVWDVVDRGKARTPQTKLKLNLSRESAGQPDIPVLDAEFLDVYKGTHGVIMMMDVTKAWTFEYVQRELPKVPGETPVLLLGNHCDMSHHRVVSEGQAQAFIEQAQESRHGKIMYGESSMRNGFGLRLLHKFLGLPFLRLQRETLLAQLERNHRDAEICVLEVNEFLKSDDADYNKFLDQLMNKRRQVADAKSNTRVVQFNPMPSTSVSGGQHSSIPELRPTKSIIVGGGQPIVIPGQVNVTNDPKLRQSLAATATSSSVKQPITKIASIQSKIASVEDFCPDGPGGGLGGFLEDIDSPSSGITGSHKADTDSEDESRGNPLVARFHDDQAEEEEPKGATQVSVPVVKINPLAKASKVATGPTFERTDPGAQHSDSSTEVAVEVDVEADVKDVDMDFDSWINDTTRRRSPEGGEDPLISQIAVSQEPFLDGSSTVHSVEEPDGVAVGEEREPKKHKKKKSKDGKKDRDDKDREKRRKKKKSKPESSGAEEDRLEESMQAMSVGDYECI